MMDLLSDVRVLAVLVAVGAFVLTYAGHRSFTTLKHSLLTATRRDPANGAVATGAGGRETAPHDDPHGDASAARARKAPGDDAFGVANAAPAAAAGRRPVAPAPRAPSTPGGRAAAGLIAKAHPPKENAFRTVSAEPVDEDAEDDVDLSALASETREWESVVREVMSEESILAERREALSEKRTLKSLLGNIRDRELLAERGHRIGRDIHATSYADLAEKLAENHVCEEASFRHAPGGAVDARLIGTAMAKEAPVIGVATCFIETGLIAGALSNMEGAKFQVREVKCVVKGDPFCEFRAERVAEEEKRRSLYDDVADGGSA